MKNNDFRYRIFKGEWYVRGLIYHCKNLTNHYKKIAAGTSSRAHGGKQIGTLPDIIIMYSPETQRLQFEFNAFICLARISLDDLRNLLSPVFITKYNNLPKSFKDFKKGTTACPIYKMLAESKIVTYMIDIRDCIVHFRSFATSDNAKAVRDGVSEEDLPQWPSPLANISFRMTRDEKIVTNIYLPDRIFDSSQSTDRKLCKFTYNEKINILSQCLEFVKLTNIVYLKAMKLLIKPGKPIYTFKK